MDYIKLLEDPNVVFRIAILFTFAQFFWEAYLSYRQRCVYRKNLPMPNILEDRLSDKKFKEAKEYGLATNQFNSLSSAFDQMVQTLFYAMNGLSLFWYGASGLLNGQLGLKDQNIILQGCIFLFFTSIFNFVLLMPWKVYETFVLEAKYGFNKQTPMFFVKDQIKKFFVKEIILQPIMALLVYIINYGGDYFFFYAWLFVLFVSIILITVYADFIAPLFDKYMPLKDGALKVQIEKMAKSLNFPLKKLYVVVGSKRSSHSNAYMYGFWNNKRIVLYDTLIKGYEVEEETEEKKNVEKKEEEKNDEKKEEKKEENEEKKELKGCENEEIVAVLMHELGHWKMSHVFKHLVVMQTNIFLIFLIFSKFYKTKVLYEAFGFSNEQPVLIGLIIILQCILIPYNEFISFLTTVMTRKFEFDADRFAAERNHGDNLSNALVKLTEDNLGYPYHDYLFSMWHHSHPTLLQRLEAIKLIKRKKE